MRRLVPGLLGGTHAKSAKVELRFSVTGVTTAETVGSHPSDPSATTTVSAAPNGAHVRMSDKVVTIGCPSRRIVGLGEQSRHVHAARNAFAVTTPEGLPVSAPHRQRSGSRLTARRLTCSGAASRCTAYSVGTRFGDVQPR
jgi:hypothetical protein